MSAAVGAVRTPRRVAAGALCLALAVGGCSPSPDQSPAQARRDRVQARLRSTFSATQSRCILEKLDTSALRALDRKSTLPANSPDLRRFSAAVAACVNSGGTTATPSTSTTG